MAQKDDGGEKGRIRKRKPSEEVGDVSNKRLKSALSEDEEPSKKLLNRIADHVICSHLQAIATDLGI